ncbi:MAG: ribosome biogenesis GTP-binding protein YihA/YsxC [Desulfomonilia bacterium]
MIVKIQDAKFAGRVPECLPRLPECAFAGRSNVGKSSLINRLLNRRSLVKTSKQPGKTRAIDFFRVDLVGLPSIYLVDLPGYGYARVSHALKNTWDHLIKSYLLGENDIRLIVLLVDIRRDPKNEEYMVLDLAQQSSTNLLLAATKADKLSYSQRQKRISEISRQYGMTPVLTSARTGDGMDTLWEHILHAVKG